MTAGVTALHLADLVGVSAAVARRGGAGERLSVPLFAYLVEDGSGELTVVDLGCGPHDAGVPGRPHVDSHRSVADAVRSLGHDPAAVGTVVLSHLHWDHCVGIDELPRARVLVQRAEMAFAADPGPQQEQQYDAPLTGRRAAWRDHEHRLELVDGRRGLGCDLEVLPTPGHTPGSQSLLVRTVDRDLLLCGDLFMSYDQWTADPGDRIPPGLCTSLEDWHRSMDVVDRLGCLPLPAHEPRVLDVLTGRWTPR